MKAEPGKVPPLSAWVVAAAVFVAATVISISFEESGQEYFESLTRSRLAEFARTDDGFKIIFIGTSQTEAGVLFDGLFEKAAASRDPGSGRIRFLRIARIAGQLKHFFSILGPILDARPDLVLIESGVPLIDRGKSALAEHQTDVQNVILNYGKLQASKEKLRIANTVEGQIRGIERRVRQDSALFAEYCEKRRNWKLTDLEPPEPLAEFYERAAKNRTSVMLIDIPRHKSAESKLPTADNAAVQKRLEYLREKYGVEFISSEIKFALHDYSDFSHLRPTGREAFSDWLLTKIGDFQNRLVTTR